MSSAFGCSFCGKPHKEVKKLIAGPSVYICDACIRLCRDIVDDEWVPPTGTRAAAAGRLLARLYEDIVAGTAVAKEQTPRRLSFGGWRGFRDVTICRHNDTSLYASFWLGGEEVMVDTMAPGWLADRVRMIWMESNLRETHLIDKALALLDGAEPGEAP